MDKKVIICNHWLCVDCWQKIYDKSIEDEENPRCPFCREDISNWICRNLDYTNEDSDEEDEHCNQYCKQHYVEKFLEDVKHDIELLNIFKNEIQKILDAQ